MLHRFDDFPLHQSGRPLLHPVHTGPDLFDRYSFTGYADDGSLVFGFSLGLYPARGIIDAAFSALIDGEQVSVLASGRAPADRTRTRIGPLELEVVEPMRMLRIACRAGTPLDAELTFTARTAAVEEPPLRQEVDGVTVADLTRVTQWGAWSGTLTIDGHRFTIEPAVRGSRERSWGVRPLDGPAAGPVVSGASRAPSRTAPQRFWLAAPLNFEDCAVHLAVEELTDGRRRHAFGAIVPALLDGFETGEPADPAAARAAAEAADDALLAPPIVMRAAEYVLDWEPGTRRSAMASIILEPYGSADTHIIRLEPLATFHLAGLGFGHPTWGHGSWHGEEDATVLRWRPDELDPADPAFLHVLQVVAARWGSRSGTGVLEQLAIGNHDPTGLSGLFDPAG